MSLSMAADELLGSILRLELANAHSFKYALSYQYLPESFDHQYSRKAEQSARKTTIQKNEKS